MGNCLRCAIGERAEDEVGEAVGVQEMQVRAMPDLWLARCEVGRLARRMPRECTVHEVPERGVGAGAEPAAAAGGVGERAARHPLASAISANSRPECFRGRRMLLEPHLPLTFEELLERGERDVAAAAVRVSAALFPGKTSARTFADS